MAVRRLTVNNNKRQSGHGQRLLRGVRSRSLTIIIYLFLAAISVTVFGQTIRYDFVNFDDDLYVYNAPAIQAGLTIKGIALAFTTPHARNWHPLATISHMLDCQLYGLKAGGHHATNILLHTIAVLLLFRVLRQMTGAIWRSVVVAALFAVHPLHVESVAWVSERKDVLSAGSCVITFVVQKRATGAIPPLPFPWRLQNAFASYVIYVWKTLWPTRLAVFYPHPDNTLAIWEVILAIGFLLAITVAAIVFRRERSYLFTGWFWYLGMLVPVIGLVQVGEQGYADRYTYLPHIGLFLVLAWSVADISARSRLRRRFAAAVAVTVIIAFASCALMQTTYWRNSETLWTHTLAVTSNNDIAHNNLGYLCVERGDLDKAISHFEEALKIRSGKPEAHYDVGSAFVQMNLADALARKGQSDEAMIHYEEAIKLQPNYAEAYYNRGNVLLAKGRIDEAIVDLEKTLQIQPDDADAHTCLGNALLLQGLLKEAIAHYEKALALAPEDPHARNNIAWVLATSSDASIRDGARAVEFAQEAVELSRSRDPNFLRTLAAAYAENGRFSEAIAAAKQAIVIANMQGSSGLAKTLESELMLYRGHFPLREDSLGD